MKHPPDATLSSATLAALVSHPATRAEHVAAWIARDAHPWVSPKRLLAHLDRIADDPELRGALALDAHEQAALLVHHLSIRHGFAGNTERYEDPENTYLDSVLKRRRGIPISLAVVYIAVGQRLGVPTLPLGFPGHLLLRVGSGPGALVDPFAGCLVHERELPRLLSRVVGPGRSMRPEYLNPLDARQFAQRMLLNLKLLYHARQEHGRAFLVTERLLELAPSPELRRDRGLYALQLGAHRVAAADLAHYLLKRPTARDAPAVRSALSKSRKDIPHAN